MTTLFQRVSLGASLGLLVAAVALPVLAADINVTPSVSTTSTTSSSTTTPVMTKHTAHKVAKHLRKANEAKAKANDETIKANAAAAADVK